MKHRYVLLLGLLLSSLIAPPAAFSQVEVIRNSRHNTSRPLRDIPTPPARGGIAPYAIPNKFMKFGSSKNGGMDLFDATDPALQSVMGTMAASVGANFEGASDDDNAAVLGFRVVPPDTDGDVGPNYYVQWINSVSEIFDRNGASVMGPFPGNQYFQGLGGDCEDENNGDPIVLYDELADRWLVSQFAVEASPYYMCIAISTTSNPMGSYYQYAFSFGQDFPDYPKLGIWGDSYTMTTRDFRNGAVFNGISAVAFDRNAMLLGDPNADMVRVTNAFSSISDGALPADSDGPISGPALFGAHGADGDATFELWQLAVDWSSSNPTASFSAIPGVGIGPYDGNVPSANQPNGQVLDDLSGFTMHRLNARDFGSHVSLVANHTVETSPGVAAIRWYEFRNTGGNWVLYQQGTYSPDNDDRWMGSIAINANGDIALGYTRSSSSLFPSIYFTGQTADQSGTGVMNIAETLIHAGQGSQSGASRWGDYSMMSVDPNDNTSFWYTTEYYAETNSFDFKTRIASFQLGGGGSGNNPPIASYTYSCFELDCDFTDTSTDSDGSIASWAWDFGDGNTSTAQNPGHTFAGAGTYGVVLTVTDNEGATDDASQDVTVSISGNPTSVHVASIVTGTESQGRGQRLGTATVTLVDDLGGNPGSGITVEGDFSGTFNETRSGVTDGNGVAGITSSTTAKGKITVNFCVSNVLGGSLPYDASSNPPGVSCSVQPDVSARSETIGDRLALSGDAPFDFDLAQNYPNPFNPTTIVSYSVPEATHVTVRVFNMLGQEVARLVDDQQEAGRYNVPFNANDLSAGIYLYTIEAGSYIATRRMTLLK